MFQVSQDSNLLLQTYAMAKGFPSPQQKCYTWANLDPQLKPELAIPLQEKITGNSKLICIVSLSVILFHQSLLIPDFSKRKHMIFVI